MRQKKNVLALEAHLGTELHRRSTELTRAWLDRLLERLDVSRAGSSRPRPCSTGCPRC